MQGGGEGHRGGFSLFFSFDVRVFWLRTFQSEVCGLSGAPVFCKTKQMYSFSSSWGDLIIVLPTKKGLSRECFTIRLLFVFWSFKCIFGSIAKLRHFFLPLTLGGTVRVQPANIYSSPTFPPPCGVAVAITFFNSQTAHANLGKDCTKSFDTEIL